MPITSCFVWWSSHSVILIHNKIPKIITFVRIPTNLGKFVHIIRYISLSSFRFSDHVYEPLRECPEMTTNYYFQQVYVILGLLALVSWLDLICKQLQVTLSGHNTRLLTRMNLKSTWRCLTTAAVLMHWFLEAKWKKESSHCWTVLRFGFCCQISSK